MGKEATCLRRQHNYAYQCRICIYAYLILWAGLRFLPFKYTQQYRLYIIMMSHFHFTNG